MKKKYLRIQSIIGYLLIVIWAYFYYQSLQGNNYLFSGIVNFLFPIVSLIIGIIETVKNKNLVNIALIVIASVATLNLIWILVYGFFIYT